MSELREKDRGRGFVLSVLRGKTAAGEPIRKWWCFVHCRFAKAHQKRAGHCRDLCADRHCAGVGADRFPVHRRTETGSQGVLQAIEKCDAKKLLDTVPKDYLKEVMDEKDLTKRELLKEVQAYLDKYYSGYDDIKVSITDQEKLDRDDFSDYFDFDLEEDADLEIKKAVQFDLKVRYQSDEGKQTEKEEFIVFRYENGWYSMDAVFLVAMSAYL